MANKKSGRFEFGNDVIDVIKKLGDQADRVRYGVEAQSALAVELMRLASPLRDGRASHEGHIRDAIKATAVRYTKQWGGTWYVDVYPQGVRDDGERYAVPAYVIEFGKSDVKPKPFIAPTLAKYADALSREFMEAIQ